MHPHHVPLFHFPLRLVLKKKIQSKQMILNAKNEMTSEGAVHNLPSNYALFVLYIIMNLPCRRVCQRFEPS